MKKPSIRSRKKREIWSSLERTLEKDSDAIVQLRQQFELVLEQSRKLGVEPETLLFEANFFDEKVKEILKDSYLKTIANDLDAPPSDKECDRIQEGFERLCKVIRSASEEAARSIADSKEREHCERSSSTQYGKKLSNEMEEYVSSKERQNYIY